jgi:hypothetical protein
MKTLSSLILIIAALVVNIAGQAPQTTEFTYQGSLKDTSIAANGNYEFQFKLYDALTAGNQLGSAITSTIPVADGVFAAKLDFGNVFPGADRYLEIGVRTVGAPAYTTLTPRQRVNSAPYSIKSIASETAATATNATQLGGVAANQFVQTTDVRLTDARTPAPGSSNYIQNGTALQSFSNFNISQKGEAEIFSARTHFEIGGFRVLSIQGTGNLFAGVFAGANTTGGENTFLGRQAGEANTTGFGNTFVGTYAGRDNTANNNTFVGRWAGRNNTTGQMNAFFGSASGDASTTGNSNAFFGHASGSFNTTGSNNSFFGWQAGQRNTTGNSNTLVGSAAGYFITTASGNTFVGSSTGTATTTGLENTFVGGNAGSDNQTAFQNSFFGYQAGIGTTTGSGNVFLGHESGTGNITGFRNTAIGNEAGFSASGLSFATAVGSGSIVGSNNTIVLGRAADTVRIPGSTLFVGGNYGLTRNSFLSLTLGGVSDFVDVPGTLSANALQSLTYVNSSQEYRLGTFRFISNYGTQNTFVGVGTGSAGASSSNNTFVGYVAGDSTTGNDNTFVGTDAGGATTTGAGNTFIGRNAGDDNVGGSNNTTIGNGARVGGAFNFATAIGAGATVASNNIISLGRADGSDRTLVRGILDLGTLVGGAAIQLCRNGSNHVGDCGASSLRYKKNISSFGLGLNLIQQLKPITFDWKEGGMHDLGLGAEDVAAIEPLLVAHNAKGQVESVKYDRIGVVLINAVKEQQNQISSQQRHIEGLTSEIRELKALLCSKNKRAAVCRK